MWYYYDENNNLKYTFASAGGKTVYAGNGLFLHIINNVVYYEQCNIGIISWMKEHNCLKPEIRKLVYGY